MTHPYASVEYARAFGTGYEPIYLEASKTCVLKREIPGTRCFDAMGPYPVTPIACGAAMEHDFERLKDSGIVSLVLVTDPFYHPPEKQLRRHFDYVRPYKQHFIADSSRPPGISKHHAYEVRRAAKSCETRSITLTDFLDDWCDLYRTLVERRGISGIHAFSRDYFAAIAGLKPLMVGAFTEGRLVSAHLWFAKERYAYSHLAASSTEGYRLRAAYPVYSHSLQHLAECGFSMIDLGGGAGTEKASAGLANMKKGFSNGSREVYLCGKVLRENCYAELSAAKNDSGYFPAYRSPTVAADS